MSFLELLSEDHAAQLRERAVPRRYEAGSALFHERTAADRVWILVSGHVKLVRVTEEGRDVILGVRDPGDLLGEMAAIDGEPRSAGAVALEPVEALVLTAEDFTALLERVPGIALAVLRLVSRRLRDADSKRVEFLALDTAGRVAARIVELVDRFGTATGDQVRVTVPLTQDDLAAWTGSSREATLKALRTLREAGLIDTGRRELTVLDVAALRRRAH